MVYFKNVFYKRLMKLLSGELISKFYLKIQGLHEHIDKVKKVAKYKE